VDLLAEDRQQGLMTNVVEKSFDIPLDEPFGPDPGLADLGQAYLLQLRLGF
jgi:hypothetical protein